MAPITYDKIKLLPALIAALLLLTLSAACRNGDSPEPASTPDDIATAVSIAVATAMAQVAASPTPVHQPTPTSTPTFGEADRLPIPATATAAAIINAQAEALSLAVVEVIQQLMLSPDVRDQAIANASARYNVNANVLAAAIADAWDNPVIPTLSPTEIAIATANAESEARALATASARAIALASPTISPHVLADWATATAYADISKPKRYDAWNDHEWLAEPKPWWKPSNPYDCDPPANPQSPWTAAGLPDLGGQDPLSLIRYFGNGSYIRYGLMGFEGCTPMSKYPDRTHLDQPVDPTYYSLGDLEIAVDIVRVPVGAPEWTNDNGIRVEMSMDEAVNLFNTHVAAYYGKISEGKLRMSFVPGIEFTAGGRGTPRDVQSQWFNLIGITDCNSASTDAPPCPWGTPGALNRIILDDVNVSSGGSAWNGYADFGLVSLKYAVMKLLVHEIGHAWMAWPHSYIELPWRPDPNRPHQRPNFYSSPHDFMSQLIATRPSGWHQDLPSTLAINRYAAGWIEPEDVALHLTEQATYKLARPRESGYQFLVVHSGRAGAFTTLEVLDERNDAYRDPYDLVFDAATGQRRPLRYDGVLVSRYDQTTGTGINARVGPALYETRNPNYEKDVGYGHDDYSVIADGESRAIGSGGNGERGEERGRQLRRNRIGREDSGVRAVVRADLVQRRVRHRLRAGWLLLRVGRPRRGVFVSNVMLSCKAKREPTFAEKWGNESDPRVGEKKA